MSLFSSYVSSDIPGIVPPNSCIHSINKSLTRLGFAFSLTLITTVSMGPFVEVLGKAQLTSVSTMMICTSFS